MNKYNVNEVRSGPQKLKDCDQSFGGICCDFFILKSKIIQTNPKWSIFGWSPTKKVTQNNSASVLNDKNFHSQLVNRHVIYALVQKSFFLKKQSIANTNIRKLKRTFFHFTHDEVKEIKNWEHCVVSWKFLLVFNNRLKN